MLDRDEKSKEEVKIAMLREAERTLAEFILTYGQMLELDGIDLNPLTHLRDSLHERAFTRALCLHEQEAMANGDRGAAYESYRAGLVQRSHPKQAAKAQ